MSHHSLTISLAALALAAPGAHAQFFRGSFRTPAIAPASPVMSATVAPQSAPGSIFPGPGPSTRPPGLFFSPFGFGHRFRGTGGFVGGFGYPYYDPYYDYDYAPPVTAVT